MTHSKVHAKNLLFTVLTQTCELVQMKLVTMVAGTVVRTRGVDTDLRAEWT